MLCVFNFIVILNLFQDLILFMLDPGTESEDDVLPPGAL